MVNASGSLAFRCHHSHCSELRNWKGFKQFVEERFHRTHPNAPAFQWSLGSVTLTPTPLEPRPYQNRVQTDPEPPFVQPSIIVEPARKTQRQKASDLLNRLLPRTGSRCLLRTVFEQAAAEGISKRAIQRGYKSHSILPVNNDEGAWLVRQEPTEELKAKWAGGEIP